MNLDLCVYIAFLNKIYIHTKWFDNPVCIHICTCKLPVHLKILKTKPQNSEMDLDCHCIYTFQNKYMVDSGVHRMCDL